MIHYGIFMVNIVTMWGPPVINWFINPSNYSYLRTINHSEIGVMFTNLAIVWGPHFVGGISWYVHDGYNVI